MRRVLAPVIGRNGLNPGGDDVPCGPAARNMVDGGELAGQIVRLGIGARAGGHQPDMLGLHGQRGEHDDRIGPEAPGLHGVLGEHQHIGEEDRIEPRRLGLLGEVGVIVDIHQRARIRPGMIPRGLVVAAGLDEEIQMDGFGHGAFPEQRQMFLLETNIRIGRPVSKPSGTRFMQRSPTPQSHPD
jgi:hypothetical protein